MISRLVFAFGLVLAAGGAQADERWRMVDSEGMGTGAYYCPVDDRNSGNFLCLRLECTDTKPLYFDLAYVGGPVAPQSLPAGITVDGAKVGDLDFNLMMADGDYVDLTALFDPVRHTGLVEALRHGQQAQLRLEFPGGTTQFFLPLKGSSVTLGNVMAACPVAAAPSPIAQPMGGDDPAAQVLSEIKSACAEMGGTISVEPGFETRQDLNGDGRDDLVIDYASAACSEAASLYCGSGGCTTGLYLDQGNGEYRELYTGVLYEFKPASGQRLALSLHGSACDLVGYEACVKVYDISSGSMVLTHQAIGEEAIFWMRAQGALDEDVLNAPGVKVPAPDMPGDAEVAPAAGGHRLGGIGKE
ncbi:MAG: hypothetical protein P8X43_03050 [Maritimibacter sp.]